MARYNKYQCNKKSQSLSTDILVVVVIILFGALFLVLNKINDVENGPTSNEKYTLAAKDSQIIVEELRTRDVLDSEDRVNVDVLMAIDEAELKESLGIKNDFCIVFEKDGKLVKIDPQNDINGIGSENIIVNGVPCN